MLRLKSRHSGDGEFPDGFGLTGEEILTRSLTAAAVIGLALATYYFGEKRRKPRDR